MFWVAERKIYQNTVVKSWGGHTALGGDLFATAFLQFLLRLKKVGKGGEEGGESPSGGSDVRGRGWPKLQPSNALSNLPLPYPD